MSENKNIKQQIAEQFFNKNSDIKDFFKAKPIQEVGTPVFSKLKCEETLKEKYRRECTIIREPSTWQTPEFTKSPAELWSWIEAEMKAEKEKTELKSNIEHNKIIGEFKGFLKGLNEWWIPSILKNKISNKINELNSK